MRFQEVNWGKELRIQIFTHMLISSCVCVLRGNYRDTNMNVYFFSFPFSLFFLCILS